MTDTDIEISDDDAPRDRTEAPSGDEGPIVTSIARHYYWRQVITAVICVGRAVWGAYELWGAIPQQEDRDEMYQEYLQYKEREDLLVGRDRDRYEELVAWVDSLEGEMPEKPNVYDKPMQWLFISCILYVPWAAWQIRKTNKRNHRLDENGDLHLPDGETWTRDEIAGIDMSKWMAKSIAWVIHQDSRRFKLDAYLYRDLEHIIGRIAHRFEPEQWNPDGTKVKPEGEEELTVPADPEDDGVAGEESTRD